jgi:hypothetical protein
LVEDGNADYALICRSCDPPALDSLLVRLSSC